MYNSNFKRGFNYGNTKHINIYKRDRSDYLGTELKLVEVTNCTWYYAKFRGANSIVISVGKTQMEDILNARDDKLFVSLNVLHASVLRDMERNFKRVTENINRYKNTGKYFEKHEVDNDHIN